MKELLIRRRYNLIDVAFFIGAGAILGHGYELIGLSVIAVGYLAGSMAEALWS